MIRHMRTRFNQDTSRPTYKPEPRKSKRKAKAYGHIPEIAPGKIFSSRKACAEAGVHGVPYQGIHSAVTGAYSVCLSGTYEDDDDNGDTFVYTGTGGKANPFSSDSKQVQHQSFRDGGNRALKMSAENKRPVRVVRGPNEKSKWAPDAGFRYDGLYQVVRAYFTRGASGNKICKFQFRKLPNQPPIPVKPTSEVDTA